MCKQSKSIRKNFQIILPIFEPWLYETVSQFDTSLAMLTHKETALKKLTTQGWLHTGKGNLKGGSK
jgi:hypothetical protein